MKSWLLGMASAAAVVYFFPTHSSLGQKWTVASVDADTHPRLTDSIELVFAQLPQNDSTFVPDTAAPPPDPFRLSSAALANRPSNQTPMLPPPPRLWSSTGRVGQRAAVLTASDGRILVVSDGSQVDSAVVVSIGSDGVVLEDRGGRFVLRIP